ncbi:putative UDP-glycosyltransferase 84B1 [Hypsibius exemplaris]|uniref:UDP-glucuronosyltransferase n=1 Tax=Hypsibius exemplaris TaxID=2072580 RepID=A0A1W0WQW8_HYPEX|nr:putative UDP-glycosyltransferase 84B1 [Hypsibius exemplaris]
MEVTSDRKHALFVALPAFGHITPLMELAKKLTAHNFHITFAVSEAKADEMILRGYLPERFRTSIDIHVLRDGLPADIDTRPSPRRFEEMQTPMEGPLGELLENMASTREPFLPHSDKPVVLRQPVDVVVCDSMMYQPPTVCTKRGIPCYLMHTAAPFMLPMLVALKDVGSAPTVSDDTFLQPVDRLKAFTGIPVGMVAHLVKMEAVYGSSGTTPPLHRGILINGFEEMDPALANHRADDSLHYIGPLLQKEEPLQDPGKAALAEKVAKWLDWQTNGSVIYLSFGSMVFPQPHELLTLGRALLALGKPFIFALRAEQQVHLPEIMQEKIAEQFDTPYAPYLVIPWAQQQRILAHPATKVFLSHCGWNSTLETLSYGKPVVAWPFFADQPMDADYLAGLGMAVRIPQTSLRTTKVTTVVELLSAFNKVGAWGSDAGNDSYFRTAQEMAVKAKRALDPGGSSFKNFQRLLELFRS